MRLLATVAVMAVVLVAAFGGPVIAQAGSPVFIPQVPTRTVNRGYPSNVDPRFGPVSSRPTFESQPPVHPAFRSQPIIIQPGPQTPVVVPPDAQFACVPGQWFRSGTQWVWYPGFCTR